MASKIEVISQRGAAQRRGPARGLAFITQPVKQMSVQTLQP